MPTLSRHQPQGTDDDAGSSSENSQKKMKRILNTATSSFFHEHGHSHDGQQKHGWGRGIIHDFKTTIGKHWYEEMRNFNAKTIGVSFFLFIAVIAPCITFGAVYAKRTNNYMGAVELLLATAWCGIFYSLVSGMPMVRSTGCAPLPKQ